jgi:hypothetical protein
VVHCGNPVEPIVGQAEAVIVPCEASGIHKA